MLVPNAVQYLPGLMLKEESGHGYTENHCFIDDCFLPSKDLTQPF